VVESHTGVLELPCIRGMCRERRKSSITAWRSARKTEKTVWGEHIAQSWVEMRSIKTGKEREVPNEDGMSKKL